MKENGAKYILDAQGFREILEYSSKFYENRFYVVIDAESFYDFNCFQLSHDLLLITNFCQVKLIIIISCFPSKGKISRKKRTTFLQQILSVTNKLENYFNQITMVGIGAKDNFLKSGHCSFKPDEAMADAEKKSITIFQAVRRENGEPVDIIDVNQAISELRKADKKKLFSKVIILSSHDGIYDSTRNFLPQIFSNQARAMVKDEIVTGPVAEIVRTAVDSIEKLGIERVHIINGRKSGGLLVELYTKEGFGTMIYRGNYEEIRPAKESDTTGIYALILHYAKSGIILQQSFNDIRRDFADFIVATIDDHVVACARLRCFDKESKAFISSVAVSPHFIRQGIGKKLLAEMEVRARTAGMNMITLVGLDWWVYHGFDEGELSDLPEAIKRDCTLRGNPKKVLIKKLSNI